MYLCKSKNHVWKSKADADKCCNGYERIIVYGEDIPNGAKNIQVNKKTGLRSCRIWVKEKAYV